MTDRVQSAAEIVTARKWLTLTEYLQQWFYKPDIQAIAVILTCVMAQFDPHSEPIWMFLNGPSGSGKTAIGINPLIGLPNMHFVDCITAHTFISGYVGNDNASLVHRIGSSGTIAFPDFTTYLSLREDVRKEIAGQMRKIFDGQLKLDNGALTNKEWKGKITIIAAVTPVIERYWGLLRDMGDRFLQVRWPRHHGPSVAKFSRRQSGHEKEIKDTLERLYTDFFTTPAVNFNHIPQLTESQGDQLDVMAEIACTLRANVTRESTGSRAIIDIPTVEQTGRVGKGLPALARYHAMLHRRDVITPADMEVARRVALDSLPNTRATIMKAIPFDRPIGAVTMMELTGIHRSTLQWNIDELTALGAVRVDTGGVENTYEMTPTMAEMWKLAFTDTADTEG